MNCIKSCKYQYIAEKIEQEIFSRNYEPDYPLPSIRNYAQKYCVNTATISRALTALKQKGIIYSYRTNGYFISKEIEKRKLEIVQDKAHNLFEYLKKLGLTEVEIKQLLETVK